MPAPQEVIKLIENFERNLDAYRSGKYNETQVRRDFIDPFFKALGWDMDNSVGYAEAYRDVIHEDAIKIGLSTKAPDYSFRVGGQRKFFLEAKKPSVNVKNDVEPAFQLRRYAWSAKLPLSIVTDFEEFAIYDCRQKPDKGDKASKSRLFYCTFRDYVEKWDEIAAIFSKDAVLKGSFDKYAVSTKGKRGTTEVDSAFLQEIEGWRDVLARNIALRNANLSQRELNFSVQQTIDRIIFLRICEDRGIEPYGKLMVLQNGVRVYDRLREMFRDADDRYNSGLFHFKREKSRPEAPDELTLTLVIDDKPLKEIFKNLYYPDCPYEFSVLGAEILGSVYEQFLGKVIRLTAGNRAVVEDKPEVKKAGGVFYTPAYIVKYIVEHTVGKLLEGKSSKQAAGITILDPACGSGSFLIGAYQYLLDWYLVRYVEEGAEKHSKGKEARLRASSSGEWRLTTSEKKRILLAHIYGVDIDAQAVEVTKLSLLLKVLEGESDQTLTSQMKLFHERVLPDLEHNIQCGNSLIGPDFYDGQLELDGETAQRINVFDWQAAFPQVFKVGGFDAVIGNPPYGALFSQDELNYLLKRYQNSRKFPDSYCLFIEQSISILRADGLLSFITPNTFCDLETGDLFRRWLLNENNISAIWQSGWAFKSAIVDTLVFVLNKRAPHKNASVLIEVDNQTYFRKLSTFNENSLRKIDYRNTESSKELLDKISRFKKLGELVIVKAGVKMYEKGKGVPPQTEAVIKERPFSVVGNQPKNWKALYRGGHIQRYSISSPDEFVNYGAWLAAPRSPELFLSPKILMRRTSDKLFSCLEEENAIAVNSCHVIKFIEPNPRLSYYYLLALLNSSLLQKIFELQNPQMVGKVFAEIKVIYVERLPIREINFDNKKDSEAHDLILKLVQKMLTLNKQATASKTPQDTNLLQRQITATDKQIDQLVYQLYGLTAEEIELVEGAT